MPDLNDYHAYTSTSGGSGSGGGCFGLKWIFIIILLSTIISLMTECGG